MQFCKQQRRKLGTHARIALAASLIALLGACASLDPYAQTPMAQHMARGDAVGDCARLYRRIDRVVDAAGVRDAAAPRVGGFPYLRVDRFNAAQRDRANDNAEAHDAWQARLLQLDRSARMFELSNAGLPSADAAELEHCRALLQQADRAHAPLLRARVQVPDDYSSALRIAGGYSLTKLIFAAGIGNWHAETRAEYAQPLEALPRFGKPMRYAPRPPVSLSAADATETSQATNAADPADASQRAQVPVIAPDGVPVVTGAALEQLIAQHAPALQVDTVDDNDRIGIPRWHALAQTSSTQNSAQNSTQNSAQNSTQNSAQVRIDTRTAAATARVAYTRIRGHVHLQLIYTFWFPARPADGVLDILAGPLDGLVWRVTLRQDAQGQFEPLVYDTIHPCGCYHMFFSTQHVQARPQPWQGVGRFDEGLFVPQTVTAPVQDERVVLHVAARTHYLQRVTLAAAAAAAEDAVLYALGDDDELRALPLPREFGTGSRTRSAFGTDGLIAGSERLERFLFWPMGIASAGQMRQWGRHATAFVGRRHFDDPDLIDKYFVIRDQ